VKLSRLTIAGLFAAIFLASCAVMDIREGASPGIQIGDEYTRPRMNSVAILDQSLQISYVYENLFTGAKEYGHIGKISVESTGSRLTPTGTLETWAVLRNRTNWPLQLECNVQFFDSNNVPVEGPTAWQRVMLSPNEINSYKEFSASATDVAFYYIQVREAR
jgi:hypothetical protein